MAQDMFMRLKSPCNIFQILLDSALPNIFDLNCQSKRQLKFDDIIRQECKEPSWEPSVVQPTSLL